MKDNDVLIVPLSVIATLLLALFIGLGHVLGEIENMLEIIGKAVIS